jgi:hypothetical protein
MKKTVHILALSLAVICGVIGVACGQGVTQFRHFGEANPTTEGFTLLLNGSPSLNPVLADQGLNAWQIGLGSTSDLAQYYRNLTATELASAENGWVISLTLRILSPYQSPPGGIFGELTTGTKIFPCNSGLNHPVTRLSAMEILNRC